MKLSIDKALRKGIKFHKSGKAKEASKYYKAVLKAQPKHPDANHNMGLLVIGGGKVEAAIPFFKMALEANPSKAQFWLSYINALIRLERIAEAMVVFDQAKSKGAKGDEFDQIEKIIGSPYSPKADDLKVSVGSLKTRINTFYTSSRLETLDNAASGWLYNIQFDKKFLIKDGIKINADSINKNAGKPQSFKKESQYQDEYDGFTLNNIVAKLNEIEDVKEKFCRLESLNCSENKILFGDSFSKDKSIDLRAVQENLFKEDQLNIVIIGAGPCGLYLANALKTKLKNDINILVLDNHCDERHFKKPFSRRWLSHLPMEYFDKYFDPAIRDLAGSFGTDGYIGLPINFIEVLLLISAKKLGVKFYFEQKFDYSFLKNSLISLVFDASGGRVSEIKQETPAEQEIVIQIPNIVMNFDYAGIKAPFVNDVNSKEKVIVTLKNNGFYHYPYFNNKQLFLPMVKLTQVPLSLHSRLMKFVQSLNNNRFYVWSGKLTDEINELLILINLKISEFDYLKANVSKIQKLSKDLIENPIAKKALETDLLDFLKLCAENEDGQININSPFIPQSPINLKPLDQTINGMEIYPIGDALFRGNPKVGNGLAAHLRHIAKLVQAVTNH